ncbi:hypothetical protein VPNG_06302 [Cytospora leucostoma]|uniref:Uncharacterized protein n=1 Tax=Cytospora leucostoma TaxID=1230097 RepID=A0A423X1W4_9PEZI|nr:hypothetical protein VPNG_06302 [Cytospora leucostoma]
MESSKGAGQSAGNQRDPRSFDNRPGELHISISPNRIHIGSVLDHNGRRLFNLRNVPLGHNYIAPQINDGDEFAIGGDNAHIIKTLTSHLKFRSDEAWHIVGIPESHLRNIVAAASSSNVAVDGQDGPTQVPASTQAPQQHAQGAFGQGAPVAWNEMGRQHNAEYTKVEGAEAEKQPGSRQSGFGSSKQHNRLFQQGQQSGYPPQSFGTFGHGGGSAQGYMQGQQHHGNTQQGGFGGFSQVAVELPSSPLVQQSVHSQRHATGAFGQHGASSSAPVTNWANYDALAPGADVFYVPEEDDWIFQGQGVARNQPNNVNHDNGNTASPNYAPYTDTQVDTGLHHDIAELEADTQRARDRSPERFEDKSGNGQCDWCERRGHEAIDCIRWDPESFDKAVCVACNNVLHGIDECPKFNQMDKGERAFLLLDKGAHRPGVRSRYHAWPDYCTIDYWGNGFPMTRGYLRELAENERLGPVMRNVWKIWDYRRSLPQEFQDPRLDNAIAIALADLDERFIEVPRPSSVVNGTATNNAGHQPQVGSMQGNAYEFDNIIAHAAHSDETPDERVQRNLSSVSEQLQSIDAVLGQEATTNGVVAGVQSADQDELRGIGTQFHDNAADGHH